MNIYKKSLSLFKYNISSILLFELMYKLLSIAIMTPVLYSIFMLSLKFAHISYINEKTFTKYLLTPSTYVILLFFVIALSAYIIIQASGIIYAIESSNRNEKVNPLILLIKSVFNSIRVIRPRNVLFGMFSLLVMPFTCNVMVVGSLAGLNVPDFIKIYVFNNRIVIVIAILLYMFFCFAAIKSIFSFNFYTLYRLDFKTSVKESNKLIKGHTSKVLFGILLLDMFFNFALVGIQWTVVYGIATVLKKIIAYKSFRFAMLSISQVVFLIVFIILSLVATPFIYSYICAYYYELERENQSPYLIQREKRHKRKKEDKAIDKKTSKVIVCITVILGIVLNCIYLYLNMTNRYRLNFWYNATPEITAHRGDSYNAPENTMAAIRLAKENQADVVEIDVRLTADGVPVLLHDFSLYRTTGVDATVKELSLKEIKELDAGIRKSPEYEGERIPTLEEVVEYAVNEDVFLNIELKPAKDAEELIDSVLNVLDKYSYDRCVIASNNYNVLKLIKEKNEDIKTVYIIYAAMGEIGDLDAADVYSLRYSFITAEMVREAHRNGKEVYAWTVDDEKKIKNLLLIGVDSIITNNPYNTKEIVYSSNDSLFTDIINALLELY